MTPAGSFGRDYSVFGRCLRSELEFPDLSPADTGVAPDWTFRLSASEPPAPGARLGSREISPRWAYDLYEVQGGLRLDYGGIGSFCLLGDGREIVWFPGSRPENPEVREEMARAIVLGPVLALALHREGILCLHGSAVTVDDRAVAFLAPKYRGKSTFALALTAAGARLLTDDLVAVDVRAPRPRILPGVHSVRLWQDSAGRLEEEFADATRKSGFKTTLTDLPGERLAWTAAELEAVYVLVPMLSLENARCVDRERLPALLASAALAKHKKLHDELIGFAEAGAMLDRIADLARRMPVYRLDVLRDLDRLPDAARDFLAWHRPAGERPIVEGSRP